LRIGLFYFGTSISQKHGPHLQNSSALTCFVGVPQMAPTDNQGCRPLISIAEPWQAKWPSAILHQPQTWATKMLGITPGRNPLFIPVHIQQLNQKST
jgi:hypothetical protein